MSLGNYKIKDTDIASKGVVAAPDKLTGSAEENKKIFDRLIRESVKGLYNGMVDALEELGVEHAALLPENAAGFKYIRLNSDKVLEVSLDGQMLRQNATLNDVKSMGSGLYIINGVKVLVK